MADMMQLTLTGRQYAEDGEETVTQMCAQARYYKKAAGFYLLYQEPAEESGAVVKCCMKWTDSALELTKSGAVRTRMVFEAGREHAADYATPYGLLKIGIRTERAECLQQDGGLRIRIEYSLTSQGEPFSRCVMEITAHSI